MQDLTKRAVILSAMPVMPGTAMRLCWAFSRI